MGTHEFHQVYRRWFSTIPPGAYKHDLLPFSLPLFVNPSPRAMIILYLNRRIFSIPEPLTLAPWFCVAFKPLGLDNTLRVHTHCEGSATWPWVGVIELLANYTALFCSVKAPTKKLKIWYRVQHNFQNEVKLQYGTFQTCQLIQDKVTHYCTFGEW